MDGPIAGRTVPAGLQRGAAGVVMGARVSPPIIGTLFAPPSGQEQQRPGEQKKPDHSKSEDPQPDGKATDEAEQKIRVGADAPPS